MVVWAKQIPYYDKPWLVGPKDNAMYAITSVNDKYFFGCPLIKDNNSNRNSTFLSNKIYPLTYNSRINECIYCIDKNYIVNPNTFTIAPKTFEHFKRKLYERIVIDKAEGYKEYNDYYADEYMLEHQPPVGSVIVYPTTEKVFNMFYIKDEDKNVYYLQEVNKQDKNIFEVSSKQIIKKLKNIRYYSYYVGEQVKINNPYK